MLKLPWKLPITAVVDLGSLAESYDLALGSQVHKDSMYSKHTVALNYHSKSVAMMIKPTLSILLWLPLVVADYGNYGESSTSTMSDSSPTMTSAASSSGTHTVDVGEHGLSFDPDTITAAPGDMVEFHFYPGNHSVAQASFDNPCHPMSSSSFFSGFVGATGGESVSL